MRMNQSGTARAAALAVVSVLCLTGCFSPGDVGGTEEEIEKPEQEEKDGKKFTFTVKGDFGSPTFTEGETRAYMSADGREMSDLWVWDYMDGECLQSLHQTPEDSEWGQPKMTLAYGAHKVYFLASCGSSPTVDAEQHRVTWEKPADTFWKCYTVEVGTTSNGNRAVTLDRILTKLRVAVTDLVPTNIAKMTITPARWYYGWDYTAGVPAAMKSHEDRTVTVPASYGGTTGKLVMTIYGLSHAEEWTTDVDIEAVDGDGNVLGQAEIISAPMKANRSTEYSGALFSGAGAVTVSLSGEWETAVTGTW